MAKKTTNIQGVHMKTTHALLSLALVVCTVPSIIASEEDSKKNIHTWAPCGPIEKPSLPSWTPYAAGATFSAYLSMLYLTAGYGFNEDYIYRENDKPSSIYMEKQNYREGMGRKCLRLIGSKPDKSGRICIKIRTARSAGALLAVASGYCGHKAYESYKGE